MTGREELDNKKRSRSPEFNDNDDEFDLLNDQNGSGDAGNKDKTKRTRTRKSGDEQADYDADHMETEDSARSANRSDPTKSVMMRSLLTKKEAGIIIGRNGANVHLIRSKTNVRINLTDNFPGCTERVATLVGQTDVVAEAFELMALMLAGVEGNNVTQAEVSPVTLRLLIPNNHMGSIIGKGGAKIKDIQTMSDVRLNAQDHPLPSSTERQLNAVGMPDGLKMATLEIANVIAAYSDRNHGTLYYRPAPNMNASMGVITRGNSMQAAAVLANPAAAASMNPYGYNPMLMGPAGGHSAVQGRARNDMPAANVAQQIFIPNDLVGAIIGKGGAKINEIRQMSRCNIKINEPEGNLRERLVTITGTPEANQMALYLLYNRLEVEKQRIYGASNTAHPPSALNGGNF